MEALAAYRHSIGIKVEGSGVPALVPSFKELDFGSRQCRDAVLANIERLEFREPTPVQMQAVPAALAGRDVLACAPTGSGKTLAYMLPLIIQLRGPVRAPGVKAIVLAPTQELAHQIVREARKYAASLGLKIAMLTKSNAAGNERV